MLRAVTSALAPLRARRRADTALASWCSSGALSAAACAAAPRAGAAARRTFGTASGIPSPVDFIEAAVRTVHETTGLPWWLSIAATAVGARVALLPVVLYSRRVGMRYSTLKPHRQLAFALATAAPKAKKEQYLDYLRTVWIQCRLFNSNPIKNFTAALAMVPVFISFAWAIRRMAIPGSGLEVGGILWYQDLTIPDPFFPGLQSLALLNSLLVLANLMISFKTTDRSLLLLKDVCMVLVIAMTPLTAQLPQGFFMYWIPSSLFSLATTLLFRLPAVQEWMLRSAWAGRRLAPPVQEFMAGAAQAHAARSAPATSETSAGPEPGVKDPSKPARGPVQ